MLYFQLQYLENAREKLKQLDSLYGDFAKVAGLRFSSGETNLLEKTTAEAKRNEISMLFKQVEAEFLSTYSSLKTIFLSLYTA